MRLKYNLDLRSRISDLRYTIYMIYSYIFAAICLILKREIKSITLCKNEGHLCQEDELLIRRMMRDQRDQGDQGDRGNKSQKPTKKAMEITHTSDGILFNGYPIRGAPSSINCGIECLEDSLSIGGVKHYLNDDNLWVPVDGQIAPNYAEFPKGSQNITVKRGIGVINVGKGTHVFNKF